MINKIVQYIKIIRPLNALITGCAVFLGVLIALPDSITAATFSVIALMVAAMAAVGYGNVINDILDMESDRVNRPKRPLSSGAMSVRAAKIYAVLLAVSSLLFAWAVSLFHLVAALVPLALLTLYSIYFKRTRVMGNIMVALLTAYAILFGCLPRPEIKILILPAVFAFLLNFCRELIKDVQDAAGDRAVGWSTSADLSEGTIKTLLLSAAGMHLALVFAPSLILGHFGAIYTLVCIAAVIPLHVCWVILTFRPGLMGRAKAVGIILKAEMIVGLAALASDKMFG